MTRLFAYLAAVAVIGIVSLWPASSAEASVRKQVWCDSALRQAFPVRANTPAPVGPFAGDPQTWQAFSREGYVAVQRSCPGHERAAEASPESARARLAAVIAADASACNALMGAVRAKLETGAGFFYRPDRQGLFPTRYPDAVPLNLPLAFEAARQLFADWQVLCPPTRVLAPEVAGFVTQTTPSSDPAILDFLGSRWPAQPGAEMRVPVDLMQTMARYSDWYEEALRRDLTNRLEALSTALRRTECMGAEYEVEYMERNLVHYVATVRGARTRLEAVCGIELAEQARLGFLRR